MHRYTRNERCNLFYYIHIVYTQCLLKQMFSWRAQNGTVKNHILECHPARRVRSKELLNNVAILYRSNDKANLVIGEALCIYQFKPNINAKNEFCHNSYICSRIPFIDFLIVEAISGYFCFKPRWCYLNKFYFDWNFIFIKNFYLKKKTDNIYIYYWLVKCCT